MHGCSLGSPLPVNAEVDFMGGVVHCGVGVGTTISPRQAAIEKAQAELRQEYNVLKGRRRELEFLEKGGNPLDFKLANAASVSVQSTSLNNQHPEQFVTSEAKSSFALTASPHGDSVESSGRPGAPTVCEPDCADNLLLFDHETNFFEGVTNSVRPTWSNIPSCEEQLNDSQNAAPTKSRAYKRRNRSRHNCDGAQSRSTDMVPSRGGPKDVKGLLFNTSNKDLQNLCLNCNSSPNGSIALKLLPSDGQLDMVLDNVQSMESAIGLAKVGLLEPQGDFNTSKSLQDKQHSQHMQVDAQETSTTAKAEDQTTSGQRNGFRNAKGAQKSVQDKGQNSSAAFSTKGLDSESSCTQTSYSLKANNGSDLCNNLRHVDGNGNTKEQTIVFEGTPYEGDEMLGDNNEKEADDTESYASINDDHNSVYRSHQSNGSILGAEKQPHGNGCGPENEVKCQTRIEGMEIDGNTASEADRKLGNSLGDNLNPQKGDVCSGRLKSSTDSSVHDNSNPLIENSCDRHQGSTNPCIPELMETTLSVRCSADAPEQQFCSETQSKLANKAHEDSILEEARIIEAKRKRIAELSAGTLVPAKHRKSQWDILLEEMAWLANDFAQEHIWKITAAAQLCHQIASTSRLRFEEQNIDRKHKKVAHTLAKAIMEFWHSAQERSKEVELQCGGMDLGCTVQGYAVRFLRYNNPRIPLGLAEAPPTPDRTSDLGNQEMSWEDRFTEENLFYTVPSGAMETYRKSIVSHLAQVEKTGGSICEEVETSIYDAAEDNAYKEDEGETSNFCLPGGFVGKKPSNLPKKKRKNLTKSYAEQSCDLGTDSPSTLFMETKVGSQPSLLMGKRPANSLTVGLIPTKRVRTASRPRVLCPFSAGTSGIVQGPNKTDASSGDTSSVQDDPGILNCGSQIPNGFEVESAGDFEKHLPFDSMDVSKPKNKTAKHLGPSLEQRWQLDNDFQNEQKDHSKSRLDNHHLESTGSIGLFGQHSMKKPKMMRQSLDNLFDNQNLMSGSISSPVTTQMRNMSNPNKLIKILAGRDRGRKSKPFKMPAGQPGMGSPWSLFEDQALVVLVHDMGPNWELVTDAINGTLYVKCTFRNPKECMERHKVLMDRTAGDWADSAEDSGFSQPYPSTLPGIPKGSARQLFQCLQGPIEEEMIKNHFEKIITISEKLLWRRRENDNQDAIPIHSHNSHAAALSQVCPNNLNGGAPLTPLDLCDTTASSPDISTLGYQDSHASGSAIPNLSTAASVLPASGAISSLHGSSNMVVGNNFSPPSGPFNALVRDGRYGISRPTSFCIDEHQILQPYNHTLSGRKVQHSGLSVSGAPSGTDRCTRMLSGGDGVGIMNGMNRSIARPGFQGSSPSAMLNSGSVLSSSTEAMPGQLNMHSGVGSALGNSMLRPREAPNMMRPVQNPENQREMMVPELQMQVTEGNNQGVPPFGRLSSAFSNQTSAPPVRTYPIHQQQRRHQISTPESHVVSSSPHPHLQAPSKQHQAYAFHLAKERQLQQQQRLLQQHQRFATSTALIPHAQPTQPQLQNSYQAQPQFTSATVALPPAQTSSMSPMPQQNLHMPPHGLNRNPQSGGSGLTNHMGKQKQRQPQQQSFPQSGRNYPQHHQQSQSQQQAKPSTGVGRGNMVMQQNLQIDQSLVNGFSAIHSGRGQGSGLNTVQSSKPLVAPHFSSQPHPQQKMPSGQAIPSSNHQKLQPHQKLSRQSQSPDERTFQQNCQVNSDPPSKSQADQAQADQQPLSNLSEMSKTMEMPQPTVDKTTVMPAVSSSGANWRSLDQMYDSGMPDPTVHFASVGSPRLTNCAGTEPMTTVSQGLGQGKPSGSLPQPRQQQQLSMQRQLPPQQQLQQQTQHLQLGQ